MAKSKSKSRSKVKKKKPVSKTLGLLHDVLKLMDKEQLDELEVTEGSFQVKLVKTPRPGASIPAPRIQNNNHTPAPKKQVKEESGHQVKSPIAGVFYRARSPKSPPFVNVGDQVTSDQALCIIEAMKVMNEIPAGVNGVIKKIKAENGKPVSAQDPLFVIEPA